jgi:hypothetical protein
MVILLGASSISALTSKRDIRREAGSFEEERDFAGIERSAGRDSDGCGGAKS